MITLITKKRLRLMNEQIRLQRQLLDQDKQIVSRLENLVEIQQEHLKTLSQMLVRQEETLNTIFAKITTAGKLATEKPVTEIKQ